jgi:hypothetical protein
MNYYKVKAEGFPEFLVCAKSKLSARHEIARKIKQLGYAKEYKDALSQIEYVQVAPQDIQEKPTTV